MDEGKQPLSQAEQKQMQAEQQIQQAEAETGTTNVPRQLNDGQEPQVLDPRFDRDDLRQGKPPPAVRKRHALRIRRKRKEKGKPLTKEEKAKATQGSAQTEVAEDEADMTDEEVELTDIESGGADDDDSNDKKPGLVSKILGKS
ncbi:uncharacterized protein FA14DRAFT_44431 [Meira miltonrushii]|uniref:Uncharacterized protein n=1 Tax=Meira miltonrushii TaxID=1280837 RepID=A0A316VGY6_9BASI|nr:uncharacterized protein FA14DRAFT_44431 [Meira miltonrushii]PWN35593.1 hypothetical protein FA14DRAFT_44431 [Meira miltonrushii]